MQSEPSGLAGADEIVTGVSVPRLKKDRSGRVVSSAKKNRIRSVGNFMLNASIIFLGSPKRWVRL